MRQSLPTALATIKFVSTPPPPLCSWKSVVEAGRPAPPSYMCKIPGWAVGAVKQNSITRIFMTKHWFVEFSLVLRTVHGDQGAPSTPQSLQLWWMKWDKLRAALASLRKYCTKENSIALKQRQDHMTLCIHDKWNEWGQRKHTWGEGGGGVHQSTQIILPGIWSRSFIFRKVCERQTDNIKCAERYFYVTLTEPYKKIW